MSYHIEDRSYPEFERRIKRKFDINTESEIACPNCDGTMHLVDVGLEEAYMFDGTMERDERYYCDDCNTFANITQVYEPTVRRVKVMQDVFED